MGMCFGGCGAHREKTAEEWKNRFRKVPAAQVIAATHSFACLFSCFSVDRDHYGDGQASEFLSSLNNPNSFKCLNIALFTVLFMAVSREARFS